MVVVVLYRAFKLKLCSLLEGAADKVYANILSVTGLIFFYRECYAYLDSAYPVV